MDSSTAVAPPQDDYVIEPPAKQGASASSTDDYQIEIPHDSQQQGPLNPYADDEAIYQGWAAANPRGTPPTGLPVPDAQYPGLANHPHAPIDPAVAKRAYEQWAATAAGLRQRSTYTPPPGSATVSAAPPEGMLGRTRDWLANSSPGEALNQYLPGVSKALDLVPSESEGAKIERQSDTSALEYHPVQALKQIAQGIPNVARGLGIADAIEASADPTSPETQRVMSAPAEKVNLDQAALGGTQVLGGLMGATKPLIIAGVATAPIRAAVLYGAGILAGNTAEDVSRKMGATPNEQEFFKVTAFFIPDAAVKYAGYAGVRAGIGAEGEVVAGVKTPGGNFYGMRGPSESTTVNTENRLGSSTTTTTSTRRPLQVGRWTPHVEREALPPAPLEGEYMPPSGGKAEGPSAPPQPPPAPPSAPEVQTNAQIAEVTRLAQAARDTQVKAEQLTGSLPPPPPKPKIPSPAGMDEGHLSQQTVDTAGQVIQSLPPAARPKAVLEAVGNLAKWMFGQRTVLGPDNQVVNVDSQKSAQNEAVKIINAEMDRQKEQQEKAADEKKENLATAQEERDEAITPTETKKSTGNAPAVQIPKGPQVDRARAAIQGAPADATADHFDQIIRKTALVTTPVRKALVQEEVNRRANLQEDQAAEGMNGQPAAPGQSRTELQAWADGVKNGEHPFVHVPAKSDFVPAGVDGLTRTKVNGAGAFSGTYYHAPEVDAAQIRKAARDKTDPQGVLDAIVAQWKGGEKPVELAQDEVSGSELGQSNTEKNQPVGSEVAQSSEGEPKVGQTAENTPKTQFQEVYERHLADAHAKNPDKYVWPASDVPKVAAKMTASIEKGTANLDSPAIKAAAKELGIKPTRKGFLDYFHPLPGSKFSKPEPPVTLTPEVATGLHQIVEAAKADDPAATLDSVLRSKADGKIITQALVNDGIITDSANDVNPTTSLLTTRARAKVGDALLSSVFGSELTEQTPPFVREKLLGSMGSIGSIAETGPEWNLKPALDQAMAQYGAAFRGEDTQDSGPVVDAIVKKLDGSPEEMRKAFSTYAVSASAPGETPNPVLDFNVAFGTELTPEQFSEGLKGEAVSQPLAEPEKPANNPVTTAETPKPLAKGDQVTYRTNKGKERTGEVAWTDGKKVRITDGGSTVNKSVDDVKLASVVPESNGEATLVDALQLAFESGRGPKDYNGLKKIVAEFDKTEPTQLRMKEAQEAYEAMLNRVASEVVLKGGSNREIFGRMVRLYDGQPNLAIRTSTSIDNQAYSTPLPLAFIADRFAGIEFKHTSVYEPTAGNGALLIAADPARTFANEFNPARAATLKAEGFQVTQQDATTFTPPFKVDAVVANPPFGKLAAPIKFDGYNIVKLDHLIAVKALSAMKDEGRAAIILGAGSREEPGEVTNAARPFFNYIYSHYNVVSDFELDGDLYARQGASFPVRVIAIDGRTRTAKVSPVAEDIQRLKTWEELYGKASEHLGSNLEGRPRTDDELGSASQLHADTAAVSRTPARPSGQGDSGQPGEITRGDAGDGNAIRQPGSISHSGRVPTPPVGSPDITTRSDGDVAQSDRLAEGQRAPRAVRREPAEPDGRVADASVTSANALADESNQFQAPYTPRSEKKDVSVMAPKALMGPMHAAMDAIAKDVGDLDTFVAGELGYPSVEEMHAAFMGIQTDAIAAAIYQMKRGKAVIVADQCVAAGTRIYDPVTDTHAAIEILAAAKLPIHVLALGRDGLEVTVASAPFRKGEADLFAVRTGDGRKITVTAHHRFLTPDGWLTIADGLRAGHFLAYAGARLEYSSESSLSVRDVDGLRSTETVQDYLGRYSVGHSYLDDGPPRVAQGIDQASSPSQGDAPSRNLDCQQMGGRDISAERTRRHQLSDLPSRSNSSPLGSRGPSLTSDQPAASSALSLEPKRQRDGQFPQCPVRLPQSPREVVLYPRGRNCEHFGDASERLQSASDNGYSAGSRIGVEQSQELLRRSDTLHKSQRLQGNRELSLADDTGWSVIESIEFVEHSDFYDMWVPGLENYVAEGLINHNTGVGKGRVAAAMIRWSEMHGHLPIFITEKSTLFSDMYRDLKNIGSGDTINPQLVNANASITNPVTGEKIYRNQGAMRPVLDRIRETGQLPAGKNALFLTYSQINTDNRQQLTLHRLAPNAVFVLDESHNAGGASATGDFVAEVIGKSKGVVFLSATWAKRPDNLPVYAGMTDISIAIPDKERVVDAIAAGGAPLQAVTTSLLAQTGQFVRRERSFDGISIENAVDEASRVKHEKISDKVTEALRAIMDADSAFHNLDFAKILAQAERDGKSANSKQVQVSHMEFSSIVHNMVKQLLLALKADDSADRIIASIESGERPIYALENTMGSFLSSYIDGHNLAEGDSLEGLTYAKIVDRALMRTRYYNETDEMGNKTRIEVPLEDLRESRPLYDAAQAIIDKLNVDLPVSPIDHIRNRLEKAGYKVAEITGRDWRIDYGGEQPKLGTVPGIERKDRVNTATQYNNGQLDALIINRAASAGISLHASEDFLDQRPRHMIVGQPAGDVNVVMQMLGRINRTGQIVLPRYTFLSASLPAEMRPAIVLAKKMKSLNANVSSNTRSATSVKAVDMFNKYGDKIVAGYLLDNPDMARTLGLEAETDTKGEPSANEGIAMKATGHSALLTVKEQQGFMDAITEAYTNYINFLDETGQNDLEPVTYDYDARETHKERMYQGTDPSSPFGQDAHYGEYSIKRQGKSFTPEEVHAKIAETFGPEVMKLAPFQRDTLFARDLAAHYEELYTPYRDGLTTQGSLEKASEMRRRGRELLNEYRVGSAFSIEIGGDVAHAVVTDIEGSKKTSGNPYAPSSLQFTLAVNSPLRQIKVPGSQITKITTANLGRNADINHLFKDVFGDSRQKAKIITGNLLGAYGELKAGVKGRIISFTMADGSTQLGIQMPTKFDIKTDVADTYAMRAPEAAEKFLANGDNHVLQSSGQEISVYGSPDGSLSIRTKSSKATAGKFFLDPRLRELVVGGDFASSGGLMRATVKDGDELDALKVIMGKIALYAPSSGIKDARELDEKAQAGTLTKPSGLRKALKALSGEEGSVTIPTFKGVKAYLQKAVPATWGELSKAVGTAVKTPKAIGYEIASVLYPAMLADADARDIMGRALGEPALELYKARLFLDGIDKMFEGMPEKDWVEFVDRIQRQKEQPTPDLQKAGEMLESVLKVQRMAEQEAANLGRKPSQDKVVLQDRAGYFPNRYSTPPGKEKNPTDDEQMARIFAKRPFAGPKTFLKQQKYTLKEAVADGAVPLGNPVRMVLRRLQEGAKFVAAQHALWNGRQVGLIVYKSARGKMPPNFVKMQDNIARVFRPVETAEGGTVFVQGGEWVIDKDFGRIFNNYLSQDLIRNSTVGTGFVQLKTSSTAFKMGLSPFHYGTTTFWALTEGLHSGLDEFYNQGVRGLDPAHLASGAKKAATFLIEPVAKLVQGGRIVKYLKSPDDFLGTKAGERLAREYPDLPELLRLVFAGGFRPGFNEDFPENSPMGISKDFAAGRLVSGTMKAIPFAARAIAYPLFQYVIPRLKLMANVQMLSQKLEQYSQAIANGDVTPETVARNVVAVNENSFGEFNYQNNYWNNTVKTAMQLAFLAPGWKEGTWRGVGQAAKEVFSESYGDKFYEKVEAEGKAEDWAHKYAAKLPQLGLNTGRMIASFILATAIATALDKMLTGKWIWEEIAEDMKGNGLNVLQAADLEVLHARTGKYNKYGEPIRFNLPSDLRDYEHAALSLGSYAYNSLAPWLTGIINTLRNRDWAGNYVYDPAGDGFKQFKEGLYYNLLQSYQPITASNYLYKGDQQDATTKIEKTVGIIGGAPKGYDESRSVARALELRQAHDPRPPMTPEQQSEKDMLKSAPPTRYQARYALRTRNLTELDKIVMSLSYTDAKDVYDHATAEEKRDLRPIMQRKQAAAVKKARER